MEWPWTTESNPPPIQDMQKTLESPLDSKDIKTVHPKGNHPWIFIGRTNAEAEAPILWPPDAKSWLNRKDPDAGKDWRQEEKGTTEEEMVGRHHQLNGHEFEQTPGDGEGHGSLACCSPWGHKEEDMTERLNNNKNIFSRGTSLKSLLILLQYCFCPTFCFFWSWGRWNLSSPTRDRTPTSWIGRWTPNHWTTREVPESSFLSWEQAEENHCRHFRRDRV